MLACRDVVDNPVLSLSVGASLYVTEAQRLMGDMISLKKGVFSCLAQREA